jgi:hypothetical protein
MKKILSNIALLSFLLLSVNVTHAAGIVFIFGSNITSERQIALEAAAAELEQIIDFKQDIKVEVSFTELECDANSALLGFAGPQAAYSDFSGAPQAGVWYVSAQAADFSLSDAIDDAVHIGAQFSNKIGTAPCQNFEWYYGLDHNPGSGQVDFLGTAVHEFMHGLGFLSFVGPNGAFFNNIPDNYSSFLFNNSTGKSWKVMNNNERAASILSNGNLVWTGAKTTSMNSLLQTGITGGKVRIFAPSTYRQGSSTSHFDTAVHYNSGSDEVMEPFDSFPLQSIMASAAFCDMGWDLLSDTDGDGINDCDDTHPLVAFIDTDGDGVEDALDAFPNDPTETTDTDNDGTGDNADTDADNDGVLDVTDNCPLVSNVNQLDYDTDGTGNACGDDVPMPGVSGAVGLDKTGSSVAFAGDVNNDGYGDYVIGIPGYDVPATPTVKIIKDAGRAEILSGKTGAVLMSVNGAASKDAMGFAVAGGNDIDNDGFDDVVVGAPKTDDLSNPAQKLVDAGSVTVLYGSASGTRTPVTIYGAAAKIYSGSAVALGDTNNDGNADIIIGAPKDDDVTDPLQKLIDAGSAQVFSGADLSWMQTYYGVTAKAYAGTSVAAGDVDAVAGADIIIGAPNDDGALKDAGSVTVYNIADVTTPVITKQYGAVAKAFSGKSVASGDVNNDGRDDVIVGATGDDNGTLKDVGSVTVFSGSNSAPLTKKYGVTTKAGLGNSVAAGDVDGDSKADIIAGASKEDVPATDSAKKIVDAGSVSIWSGNGYGSIDTLYGSSAKDYFGFAVSAGDINSDGKADLIIGVAGDDVPAIKTIKDGGTVKIISGVDLL